MWNKLSFSSWPQQPLRRDSKSYSTKNAKKTQVIITKMQEPLQQKQSQDTMIKCIKTLVKRLRENHIDEITYVRLVDEEPNEI